jgi:hypothetical protein
MTNEPMTTAVPCPVQAWIVVTLFTAALLTGCASAERADGPTTTTTSTTTTTTTTIATVPG